MKSHVITSLTSFCVFALAQPLVGCGTNDAPVNTAPSIDAEAPLDDAAFAAEDATSATPGDAGVIAVLDSGPVTIGPLEDLGVSTLTGGDRPGDTEGPRGFVELNNPVNVIAGGGAVFVADFYSDRIIEVSADGTGRTLARDPTFARPFGLAMTSPTTLWIQTDRDELGGRLGALWKIELPRGELTLIASASGHDRGLTALPDGRLATVDYRLGTVELFDPATGQSTVLAGVAGELGYANGTGAAARFGEPRDLVLSLRGTLIVADSINNTLREVTLDGVVTTYAGSEEPGLVNGPRSEARFDLPLSLAQDSEGNIYVGDGDNFLVRRIDADGEVTTLAGSGQMGFADALELPEARFRGLEGLDVTADGRYLVVADGARGADEPFNRVRRIHLR